MTQAHTDDDGWIDNADFWICSSCYSDFFPDLFLIAERMPEGKYFSCDRCGKTMEPDDLLFQIIRW